jgi:hypothetical protein
MKSKRQSLEMEEARKELLTILKPGDTVYCVLRHVSRSGMQREISLFTEGMRCLDWYAERVLQMRRGKRDGLVVGGCGMDMGWHIIYNLGRALFPDGHTCTGRNEHPSPCPSNDHSNGDRSYEPHQHSDGGYALRSRWI